MKMCVYMRESSALRFQKQKLQQRLHVRCGEEAQHTLRDLLTAYTNSLATSDHPQPESQGHDSVPCCAVTALCCFVRPALGLEAEA